MFNKFQAIIDDDNVFEFLKKHGANDDVINIVGRITLDFYSPRGGPGAGRGDHGDLAGPL